MEDPERARGGPAVSEPMTELAEKRARFAEEAKTFAFKFRCDDCAHVLPSTRGCTLDMPNLVLRDNPSAFTPDGRWAFCKYFELGS